MSHGLGRRYAPDRRDLRFGAAAVLPETSDRTYRNWWTGGAWLDQGSYPRCVGYAWSHWLACGPVAQEERVSDAFAIRLYEDAQRDDEWAGEDYDGTSVRAGAKVLQRMGYISEYRWALTIEEVRLTVLEKAPVVFGSLWTADMSRPRQAVGGRPLLTPTGAVLGGHAYEVNAFNERLGRTGLYRVKNSWGRGWAYRGFAWIEEDDLASLLADQGEACLALESRLTL